MPLAKSLQRKAAALPTSVWVTVRLRGASSAVGGIKDMIRHVEEVAPLKRTVTQTEVGNAAAFLSSDLASGITGQVIYVDAGYEIMGM